MSQLIAVGIVGTHHDPVARIPPISPIFHVHRVPPLELYNAKNNGRDTTILR